MVFILATEQTQHILK